MRRVILILLLVAAMVPVTGAPAKAHHKRPCGIHWRLRPIAEHQDEIRAAVRRLIRCAAGRWSIPGGAEKALDVARCESGFWPWAVGGGVNLGVFQHRDIYWRSRALIHLEPYWRWGIRRASVSAFNARANVLVSIRMAHAGGWGPWSCA